MPIFNAFTQVLIYITALIYFLCFPVRSETFSSEANIFTQDEISQRILIKRDKIDIFLDVKILAPRQQKAPAALLILPASEGLFAQEARALGFNVALIDLDRLPENSQSFAVHEAGLKLKSLTKTSILLGFVEVRFSQLYVQNAQIFDGLLVREVDLEPLRALSTPIIHFWGEDAYWRWAPWRVISGNKKNIREFFISGETTSSLSTNCRKDQNPFGMMAAQKALLIALYAWVLGEPPPASRAPGPRDLILAKDVIWPDIGVRPMRPRDDRIVPRIDRDGNTQSGVRLPDHILPIATSMSFALDQQRAEGACPATLVMPFSADKAAREKSHDPRQSLVERYGSRAYFVATMRVVAEKLVKEKLLLRQDAESYVRAAKDAPF